VSNQGAGADREGLEEPPLAGSVGPAAASPLTAGFSASSACVTPTRSGQNSATRCKPVSL